MKKRRSKKRWVIPVIAAAVVMLAVGAFVYALKGFNDFYKEDMEEEEKVQELIDLAVMTAPPRDASATPGPTDAQPAADETEAAPTENTAEATPANTAETATQTPSNVTDSPQNTDKSTKAPSQTAEDTTDPDTTQTSGATATPAPADTDVPKDTPSATDAPGEHTAQPSPTAPHGDEPQSPLIVDFSVLQQINSDICAWIYNEGSNINYPVVYSSDNGYYLNHNYKKEHSNGGALFVDYRNNRDFSNVNTIIYGHYMKSGTMFGHLANYKSQSYYNSHPYMWLYTPYGNYRLDVIAGLITSPSGQAYTLFGSTEEMQAFLPTAVAQSKFKSNVDITQVTRVVTLSTCSYEYNNARFVVICSLVPIGY